MTKQNIQNKVQSLSTSRVKLLNIVHHKAFMRLCLGLAVFGILTFILLGMNLTVSSAIEVGKPCPYDIKASYSVRTIDNDSTSKAKAEAINQVKEVENFDPYAVQQSEAKIDNTINSIRNNPKYKAKGNVTPATGKSPNGKATATAKVPPQNSDSPDILSLSQHTQEIIAKADNKKISEYSDLAKELLRQAMSDGIRVDELDRTATDIVYNATQLQGLDRTTKLIVAELASKSIVANRFPDQQATEAARLRAAEQVSPVIKVVLPGQIVVREGEIVSENDIPVLEALDYFHQKLTLKACMADSLTVLCLMVIAVFTIRLNSPKLYDNLGGLVGLSSIVIFYALTAHYAGRVSPYFSPIALPAILITILYDARLATVICPLLAIYTCTEVNSPTALAVAVLTTLVGVLSVTKVTKRWDLIHAAVQVWICNVVSIAIFSMSQMDSWSDILYRAFLYGSLSGLTFSLLAAGLLPLLEGVLNVTTHVRMLEMSNPSEPALHELLSKAPGTYQHSLMVSNLAESAAQAVGADYMLCRIGAYYHDIGKTKQPHMFVENQFGSDNPHDKLPPALSAQILISHVKFGLELARQYNLPQDVVDFIAQHHGDNLASFFYQKAQSQSDTPLSEADFRYPGPKPQSKETAIVMLCDGIEAASRTLANPSKESIQALVERMVSNAINNHQLENCPLSLRDLSVIKASIVRTLISFHHHRIAYPNTQSKTPPAKTENNPSVATGSDESRTVTSKEDKVTTSREPASNIRDDNPAEIGHLKTPTTPVSQAKNSSTVINDTAQIANTAENSAKHAEGHNDGAITTTGTGSQFPLASK